MKIFFMVSARAGSRDPPWVDSDVAPGERRTSTFEPDHYVTTVGHAGSPDGPCGNTRGASVVDKPG
ncbi:hypothetical protein [Haliangium sp.]|uniref:hypothetical protein n=1 Tax=Haliangium sp. TaxID=2663208 RepID=UPI003D13FA1A